jgi:hypothetical protein
MTDQLISFETAKLAKEKEFKFLGDNQWPSLGFRHYTIEENGYPEGKLNTVNMGIAAPTQSLLQKWLREDHNMSIEVSCTIVKNWFYEIYEISSGELLLIQSTKHCNTYEKALEQGLIEALKLIKI